MPKKIQQVTKAHVISVPLPTHGATYTVISHQFVIDYAQQALLNAGFNIVDEEYRCTADGQIAQGIYKLNFSNNSDLSMMFAWTNSYNKQVKFQCVIGAYINQTDSVMISGDIGRWIRKHTGTADSETKDIIDDYISNAHMYYAQMSSDKTAMESVTLNKRKQAQLLGVLFAEYEILTTEQASIVRNQMSRPTHTFENNDSLWAFYNYVTIALQHSHPKTWMEDQRILHFFISQVCPFTKVTVPVIEDTEETEDIIEEEVSTPEPVLPCIGHAIESDEEEESTVELTEEEVVSQLYGVDNDIEVSIPAAEEEEEIVEEDVPQMPEPVEEKTIDGSDLIGTYTLDEMPALMEKIQEKIDILEEDNESNFELELEEDDDEEDDDLADFF